MRKSSVHSYGFKPGCRMTDVTSLVRQLLYAADAWNMPLIVTTQDVKWAFDSMQHGDIAKAMLRSGASPALTLAQMRELPGLRAYVTLPGVGDSPSYPHRV